MHIKLSDIKLFEKAINSGSEEGIQHIQNKHLSDFTLNLVKIINQPPCKFNIFREKMCFVGFGSSICFRGRFSPSVLSLEAITESQQLITFNRFKPTHIVVSYDQISDIMKACSSGTCALKFPHVTVVSSNGLNEAELHRIAHVLGERKNATITNVVTS